MFTDIATATQPATPTTETDDPRPGTGGPRTEQGKRVAARNATTHGLFARDVVLPHLGEDPQGYQDLLTALTQQIAPKNLLEQHYTEKIAAASWRLRRLQRWQAQLFEDERITEDQALDRLDRVMRHETALHRQIDQAIRTLGRDLPQLFEGRARRHALAFAQVTERDCRQDEEWDWQIAVNTREQLDKLTATPALDTGRLDTAPPPTQECQNEPTPEHKTLSFPKERVASLGEPGEVSRRVDNLAGPGEASWTPMTTILPKRTHAETFSSGRRQGKALTSTGRR